MNLMRRTRRQIARALLLTGMLLTGVHGIAPAAAQSWPSRPVTMVVPYAAGGTTDVIARILAPGLSEALGQQVVVENVGGGGGVVGTLRVAKSAPDGYQFVLGNVGTHAQIQSLHANPPYNAATDFVPVALLVDQSMLLAVRKDLPGGTLPQFIAHARANQAKMQYGSAGAGSPTHLACALMNAAIGIDVTHIPYRGGGPAMQDLIAGRIDYFCFNTASILPHVESGAVRAVAMLSRDRSPAVPGLASAHEQGLRDFEVGNWLAFFLPRGTPGPIVRKLHDAASRALSAPAVQDRLKQLGADPIPAERRAPEKLQAFIEGEIAKWAAIIRKANIRLD